MRPVVIEEGTHPEPFRTRKLSLPSPMVLRRRPWESRLLLTSSENSFLFKDKGSPFWRAFFCFAMPIDRFASRERLITHLDC